MNLRGGGMGRLVGFGFVCFVVICLGPGFFLMQQTRVAIIDPISTSIALGTYLGTNISSCPTQTQQKITLCSRSCNPELILNWNRTATAKYKETRGSTVQHHNKWTRLNTWYSRILGKKKGFAHIYKQGKQKTNTCELLFEGQ